MQQSVRMDPHMEPSNALMCAQCRISGCKTSNIRHTLNKISESIAQERIGQQDRYGRNLKEVSTSTLFN